MDCPQHSRLWMTAAAAFVIVANIAAGQGLDPDPIGDVRKPRTTTVSLELIAGQQGAGLIAQQWRRPLEKIGVPFQIRGSLIEIEPETKERMIGRIRQVTVIGRLADDGTLEFADRSFSRDQADELEEWIRDLKTYGAQGSPDNKPLWGLSKEQFLPVMQALAEPFDQQLAGRTLRDAWASIRVNGYELRMSPQAEDVAAENADTPVSEDVSKLATGAALAITLKQFGLGFRPNRTPSGEIELLVEPLDDKTVFWPIGWKLEGNRQQLAPKLFQLNYIELDELPLEDALAGLSEVAGVPVLVDRAQLAEEGIDPSKVMVKYPGRQTSWSIVIRALTAQGKLGRELWIDEAGNPFIWITTAKARRFNFER